MKSSTQTVLQPFDPEVVALLPPPGMWSEEDYLWITRRTNRLVELVDGYVEVLPMPTKLHQAISRWMFLALLALCERIGGDVYYAPLRLRVGPRRFREPDVLLVASANDPRAGNDYWDGADLLVEIVSPDDPDRDYVEKRQDYALAGVLEYWIIDPHRATITVLRLEDGAFTEHGVWGRGERATSALFSDFSVSVDDVFDQRLPNP
jgi:Uma2 family endonuclease